MGATAAKLLVHRLRGHRDDPVRRFLLAMELVVRESSAAAPIRRA
jgi:DNA-binding LacI/PurR family transcriptional regulator